MKDCPICRTAVDGMICPKCGHRDSNAPEAARIVDHYHFLCCHTDRGQRCTNPGTLTSNTVGGRGSPHPGPWFCAKHYPPFAGYGYDGDEAPPRPASTCAALTDQQWYNVCRFWPAIAQRAAKHGGRPMFVVGPYHPLHATSKMGPFGKAETIFRGSVADDVEAQLEREAIRAESITRAEREMERL